MGRGSSGRNSGSAGRSSEVRPRSDSATTATETAEVTASEIVRKLKARSNTSILDIVRPVGDELRNLEVGSTISFTENGASEWEEPDIRRVTYRKISGDVWSGSDDVGGRYYADLGSEAVANELYWAVRQRSTDPNVAVKRRT